MGDSPAATRDASSIAPPATGFTKVGHAEAAADQGQYRDLPLSSGSLLRSAVCSHPAHDDTLVVQLAPAPLVPQTLRDRRGAGARVRPVHNKAVNSGNARREATQ